MIDASSKSRPLRDLGSTPPSSGDVVADKYRIERVVGSGGMGVVVAARHMQLGQQVAIKLLRLSGMEPERQLEARARFLREGQAAANLSSDHVVRIHDVGTLESGEPFMVMELLRGDDLSTIIERQGPAPVPVAVDYLLQAGHAVAEAHAAGIVHRDLKPSNLFVTTRSDGRAKLKVLDFGISKTTGLGIDGFDGNLTDTRSVVGSPYYMSPEQVRDAKRVDGRTDIWSLGTILYELLVGEPPFNATTLPGICAAIAADTPLPVREVRPELPEALERVVTKCLEKNPDARFQTVAELMAALTPFASTPDSALSTAYAAPRDVMRLSEPFPGEARHARDAPTLHLQTQQSGPLSLGGASSVVKSAAAVGVEDAPDVAKPVAQGSGSGSRRREEFATSATLVSSSTHGKRAAASPSETAGSRRRVLVVGLLLVLAAAGTWALTSRKAPASVAARGPVQATAHALPSGPAKETTVASPGPEQAPPVAAPPQSEAPVAASAATESSASKRPAQPAFRPRPARPASTPAQAKPTAPSDIRLER